eukprot:2881076-Prymnesium_polylepis.1
MLCLRCNASDVRACCVEGAAWAVCCRWTCRDASERIGRAGGAPPGAAQSAAPIGPPNVAK